MLSNEKFNQVEPTRSSYVGGGGGGVALLNLYNAPAANSKTTAPAVTPAIIATFVSLPLEFSEGPPSSPAGGTDPLIGERVSFGAGVGVVGDVAAPLGGWVGVVAGAHVTVISPS